MSKTYVQPGKVLDLVAGSDLASGAVQSFGKFIGVALAAILSGAVGAFSIEGVHKLAKNASGAFSAGDVLYWDSTPGELTKTALGNVRAGIAVYDAASDATEAYVLLLPTYTAIAATVAANGTPVGSDAGTTQTLANSLQTSVNAILTSLKAAGIMA